MPDTLVPTTPASVSVPEAAPTAPTGSPATEPIPQGGASPQTAPAGPVEPAAHVPSSEPRARAKPSDYVRQRMEINRLRQQMQDMQRIVEAANARSTAPAPSQPETPPVDYNKIVWDKPVDVMNELIQKALQTHVPEILNQRMTEEKTVSNRREALELISKNEHISRDGEEGYERIVKILRENGLDDLAKSKPIEAAKAALKIYKSEYPSVSAPPKLNPLAPKPGQMSSVQTGNAAPSAPKENNVNEIQQKLQALRQRVIADPAIAMDEGFKSEIASYAKQLQEMSQQK